MMLSEKETRTLQAVVEAVIPADDYPSGWDLGVGDYLRRQFAGGDLAPLLPVYRHWLASLEREADWRQQRAFADLSLDARTALLEAVERGQVAAEWTAEPAFFREVIEHCAEGCYSDPGNGGNRAGLAWEMIGFEVSG